MDFDVDFTGLFKAKTDGQKNAVSADGKNAQGFVHSGSKEIQGAIAAVARAKLDDAASYPGLVVGFDQEQAEAAGAFPESAVSLEEAAEAVYDSEGE